ncbi:MAG TPA: hypothetical protein VF771_07230 [Longimicrobiaceae bacterium]
MYVLVQHYISDPVTFWSDVRYAVDALPPGLLLHHVFPTPDGTHAVCLWEGETVRDVKAFIETYVGHVSRNLYFQVENRASIAMPTEVMLPEAVSRATAA